VHRAEAAVRVGPNTWEKWIWECIDGSIIWECIPSRESITRVYRRVFPYDARQLRDVGCHVPQILGGLFYQNIEIFSRCSRLISNGAWQLRR